MFETKFPLKEEFLSRFPLVIFPKGKIIARQGAKNEVLYYIKSGICAYTGLQTNGAVVIYTFFQERELIGLSPELLGMQDNRAVADVVAHTDVAAVAIPVEEFRILLNNDFDLYKLATRSVLSSLISMVESGKIRNKGNAVIMVSNCLLGIKTDHPDHNGNYLIPCSYTIEDIARNIQMHRVTVSRIMSALCRENILVKTGEGWLIPNLNRLIQLQQGTVVIKVRK